MSLDLDVFQQVARLSFLSNLVNIEKGTQTDLQKKLQEKLKDELQPIPGWKLAWGPVVWKHKPDDPNSGPDYSWYVVHHPSLEFEDSSVHPTYVVAIAGTPDDSLYVWLKANFAVSVVSDFENWVKKKFEEPPADVAGNQVQPHVPYMAKGTANAVHKLLTTATPEGAVSPGKTLVQFFSDPVVPPAPRFITTGHSLGGALSPTLALALVSAGVTPVDDTLTYPSAGPSPGNVAFSDLFSKMLPARKVAGALNYQGWNLNLVNTLDIVPQAWSVLRRVSPMQNLGNIPGIYGEPIIHLVRDIILVAAVYALQSRVIYKPIPSQYIESTFTGTTPGDVAAFLKIAEDEHVTAYFRALFGNALRGMPALSNLKSQLLGVGLKHPARVRFMYPVISDFEWACEHPKEAQEEIDKVKGGTAASEAQAYLTGKEDDKDLAV